MMKIPILKQLIVSCDLSEVAIEEAKKSMVTQPKYLVVSKYEREWRNFYLDRYVDTSLEADSWYICNEHEGVFSFGA